jgi:hypothetical protein
VVILSRRDRNSENKDILKLEEKEKTINNLSKSNPIPNLPKSLANSKEDSASNSDSGSKPKRTKRLSEYHNKTYEKR